jgi:toxin-antitoxin system PIN domain toxin
VILPDVNLLVYAYHRGSPRHEPARGWWTEALSGQELVALPWAVTLGFIRLTTGRIVFPNPLTVEDALSAVESWLARPNVRIVQPTRRHAQLLTGYLRGTGTAGNLTTDAHLAALAVEHDCTLCSTDADFARFPSLSWRNPLA